MKLLDLKPALLAIGAGALLVACADDNVGEEFEDETALQNEEALDDPGADLGVDSDDVIVDEGLGDEDDDVDLQLTGELPPFEEIDADSDGWISRTELAMVEGADFTTLDADDDSRLSREEYGTAN